jgi:hypothetical protein
LRVWEETVNETEFRDVVWNPLIRFMRKRGWTIGQDGSVHRCIRALYRLGHKGGLECQMHIAGRCIEVHIWSTDWPSDNCNGHQHCFNIRRKMPYLTGLRTDLELRALKAFLDERHGYKAVGDQEDGSRTRLTEVERIERDYATCWHTDKTLGRPRVTNAGRDETSADGDIIEHKSVVWIRGRDGRVRRGVAYYRLNSMWTVVTAPYESFGVSCWEIHTRQPDELRRKVKDRDRRDRLERLINRAVVSDDFAQADMLRRVMFGTAPLYRIYSSKHGDGSYYAPNECGYSGLSGAGRYTRDEAQRLIDSFPQWLTAIPIGRAPPLTPSAHEVPA